MAGRPQKTPVFTKHTPHHRSPIRCGQTYGRLTVTGFAGGDGRKSYWTVRCVCGTEKSIQGSELTKGRTVSCGCLAREKMRERMTTHGMSGHAGYLAYRNMLDRCYLKTHFAYPRYGGRGIFVCERWHKFENFWADMGPLWERGLTLERMRNNEKYSPQNCIWENRVAQNRNRRDNVEIDTPKGKMLMSVAAEISGINKTTLCYRAGAGWPAARMFDPPDLGRKVMAKPSTIF